MTSPAPMMSPTTIMREIMREFGGTGCRFLIGERMQCGAPRRAGSSYCPYHHARCYIEPGSPAEAARLREDARAVGFNFKMTQRLNIRRALPPNANGTAV